MLSCYGNIPTLRLTPWPVYGACGSACRQTAIRCDKHMWQQVRISAAIINVRIQSRTWCGHRGWGLSGNAWLSCAVAHDLRTKFSCIVTFPDAAKPCYLPYTTYLACTDDSECAGDTCCKADGQCSSKYGIERFPVLGALGVRMQDSSSKRLEPKPLAHQVSPH